MKNTSHDRRIQVVPRLKWAALVLAVGIGSAGLAAAGPWGEQGDCPRGQQGSAMEAHRGHGENGSGRWMRMADHLDFTADQRAQLEEILERNALDRPEGESRRERMMAFWSETDPRSDDYMDKVNARIEQATAQMRAHMLSMAKTRQDIDAILTDEQRARVAEWMEKGPRHNY